MSFPPVATITITACLMGLPQAAASQVIHGRLLDERSEMPVAGAVVFLVRGGERGVARADSDSIGRFVLRAPEPGDFSIVADRLGYERARTPLLRIEGENLPRLDLLMRPEPLGLEGLEVSVSARNAALREELALFGINPDAVSDRLFITREEMVERESSIDLGSVIMWQNIPGLTVQRSANASAGSSIPLCIVFARSRSASGESRCALPVVNGIPDPDAAMFGSLAPGDVEAIVVMRGTDSQTFYGSMGGGGVVLVFTRGWIR